jgi:hypothetical protein
VDGKKMRKIAILIIAFMIIGIGLLSGCNEKSNDDDKFLNKATVIYDELYPVTIYNLYSLNLKLSDYRLELADYTLSSKYEEIRNELDSAMKFIGYAVNYETLGVSYETRDGFIENANLSLELAKIYIDKLIK